MPRSDRDPVALTRALLAAAVCMLTACLASCQAPREQRSPPTSNPIYLADQPPTPPAPSTSPASADFSDATLTVGGGTMDIRFAGRPGASRGQILKWIEDAAHATTRYFGHYPVKHVTIQVRGGLGRVRGGWTMGGRNIRITVGQNTRQADLDDDWIMCHEMFHLGFPSVPRRYHWMEEGLSTYLEPVARVRVGQLTPERVWKDMVEGLPRGQPRDLDRGLDNTPTHDRIYWGGCMFWFLADLEIRKRTDNGKSLDDAIRTILDAGGDGSVDWSIDHVIEVGDAATGTTVLKELHDRMGEKPETTDLTALWKQLGVRYSRGEGGAKVTFDDAAPLATIRKSMTDRLAD